MRTWTAFWEFLWSVHGLMMKPTDEIPEDIELEGYFRDFLCHHKWKYVGLDAVGEHFWAKNYRNTAKRGKFKMDAFCFAGPYDYKKVIEYHIKLKEKKMPAGINCDACKNRLDFIACEACFVNNEDTDAPNLFDPEKEEEARDVTV